MDVSIDIGTRKGWDNIRVVDTGIPKRVATINQVALPISAQVMANINTAGSSSKRPIEMIPFLIVEVTRAPRATAPTNSVTTDKNPTWIIVKVLAATELA